MREEIKTNYVQYPFMANKKDTAEMEAMKERALNSIHSTSDNAGAEVEAKQEHYALAMKQLNIFQANKYAIFSQLQSSKNTDNKYLKDQYLALCNTVSDAEINADVARGSLQNSLSYYSKTCESSYLADSILG